MPPAAARSASARRWTTEDTGRGTYQIVVTQIPWLVQKTRLIERMAELFNDKKLPLIAEFRDKSTEDVRVVIEPKSRTVDPGLLMKSLFKLTELESRISLNMNVLSKGKVPKVMDLAEVLKEWLDTAAMCWSGVPSIGSRRSTTVSKSWRLPGRLSQPR